MWIISIMLTHWAGWGLSLLVLIGLWFLLPDIRKYLIVPVAGLGIALLAYWKGRRNEREQYAKRTKTILAKREKAYEEIGNRNTDAADVSDRLRNGSF